MKLKDSLNDYESQLLDDPTCLYEQIVIFHQHTRGNKPIRAPVNLQFRALLATFEQR